MLLNDYILKAHPRFLTSAAVVVLIAVYTARPAWQFVTTGTGATGSAESVFQDLGVSHFVADRLYKGERLYADIAYPYGPLSAWAWSAVAIIGGNNPGTLTLFNLAGTVFFILLLYVGISRMSNGLAAMLTCTCTLVLWGESPYHPLERCLIASVLVAWEPPTSRSFRNAALVGCFLGCWQWVKFGGAVYFAAALLIVDFAILVLGRAHRAQARRWLMTTGMAASIAVAIEVMQIIWAYSLFQPQIAADVIWPSYTSEHYLLLRQTDVSWQNFVARYRFLAPGLFATILSATVILTRLCRADNDSRRMAGLLVPPVFFLLGIGTYIGPSHKYLSYMWCLSPPVAILIVRWPRSSTLILVGLYLPYRLIKEQLARASPERPVVQTLAQDFTVEWRDLRYQEAYTAAVAECDLWAGDQSVRPLVLPVGSGFYFLNRLPSPSRHTWLLPCYFRPYDEDSFLENLDNIPFIIYTGAGTIPDEATVAQLLSPTFGPKVTAAIAGRVRVEIRVNNACRIYRLRLAMPMN